MSITPILLSLVLQPDARFDAAADARFDAIPAAHFDALGAARFDASVSTQEPGSNATLADASGFNYSFVEVEVGKVDIDGVDDLIGVIGIAGSYSVAEQVFLFAEFQLGTHDDTNVGDIDTQTFELGAGFHHPLADSLDVFAKASIVHAEVEVGNSDVDDDGFALEGGLRGWASEQLELNGSLEYVDLDDSDTGVNLGVRYYFTPPVSAGFELSFFDESIAYLLNLRYGF